MAGFLRGSVWRELGGGARECLRKPLSLKTGSCFWSPAGRNNMIFLYVLSLARKPLEA